MEEVKLQGNSDVKQVLKCPSHQSEWPSSKKSTNNKC